MKHCSMPLFVFALVENTGAPIVLAYCSTVSFRTCLLDSKSNLFAAIVRTMSRPKCTYHRQQMLFGISQSVILAYKKIHIQVADKNHYLIFQKETLISIRKWDQFFFFVSRIYCTLHVLYYNIIWYGNKSSITIVMLIPAVVFNSLTQDLTRSKDSVSVISKTRRAASASL